MQAAFYFLFENYKWHYHIFGNGKSVLLAFHGFDRSGADFHVFEKKLGRHYTIYAFDLIYHGESLVVDQDKPSSIRKSNFCDMVQKFMIEKQIEKISLMGYSMGGRLALCLIEMMPGQLENIYLMAPDGIKGNFWNSFVTGSSLGKFLFKGVIHNPKPLLKAAALFKTLGLIHAKTFHFVKGEMATVENRIRILEVWLMFKELKPEIKLIQKIINRYRIKTKLFYGKYDVVIPPASGKKFAAPLRYSNAFHELQCGHKLMAEHEKISEFILTDL